MKIDFTKQTGKIKPMHAVNNAPIQGTSENFFYYIHEAGFPYTRMHDTGGAYGCNRFVDIANIFRDFDADVDDPSSYDFAFTDWLLNCIDKQGSKIFYRLGCSIENGQKIKAYYIYPPKNNIKWAKICEKIILHYNEGWADGYHLNIEYWEIWNEPDNFPDIIDNCMWKGTFQEYLELYKTTAFYLKNRFPQLKIGGYSSCGFYALFENSYQPTANSTSRTGYFIECFEKFMEFVKHNNLPLDFFSWHSYSDANKNIVYSRYVRDILNKYGYENTESILNEWNAGIANRGTVSDAANIAHNMLKLQNEKIDMLMYYNAQFHGSYCGLFNPVTMKPYPAYYAFKYFNELYKLGNSVYIENDDDNISVCAATDEKKNAVMLTNSGEICKLPIEVIGENLKSIKVYRINNDKDPDSFESLKNVKYIEVEKDQVILMIF